MFLVFDTETTGLPKRWDAPISDHDNWPRCVQIAWQLHDDFGNCVENKDFIVAAEGFNIPFESEQIHGISTALATKEGSAIQNVITPPSSSALPPHPRRSHHAHLAAAQALQAAARPDQDDDPLLPVAHQHRRAARRRHLHLRGARARQTATTTADPSSISKFPK